MPQIGSPAAGEAGAAGRHAEGTGSSNFKSRRRARSSPAARSGSREHRTSSFGAARARPRARRARARSQGPRRGTGSKRKPFPRSFGYPGGRGGLRKGSRDPGRAAIGPVRPWAFRRPGPEPGPRRLRIGLDSRGRLGGTLARCRSARQGRASREPGASPGLPRSGEQERKPSERWRDSAGKRRPVGGSRPAPASPKTRRRRPLRRGRHCEEPEYSRLAARPLSTYIDKEI